MRFAVLGTVLLLFLGACSSQNPSDTTAIIAGRLVAGPTSPVETESTGPGLCPSVVPDTEIVVVTSDGVEIRARTRQERTFRIAVPPGEVTITFAEAGRLMMAPGTITASVETNQAFDLFDVLYDTGIR